MVNSHIPSDNGLWTHGPPQTSYAQPLTVARTGSRTEQAFSDEGLW